MAGAAQGDDLGAALRVGASAAILAGVFRQLDALALAFAPVLVVVAGHLQGQAQKHGLHGFQHDLGDAIGLGGQVDHARELLGAGRTAAETAELLGVHRATLYRALRGQETSQAEARRRGAFVEDALTEADALAAGDQEGMKA